MGADISMLLELAMICNDEEFAALELSPSHAPNSGSALPKISMVVARNKTKCITTFACRKLTGRTYW